MRNKAMVNTYSGVILAMIAFPGCTGAVAAGTDRAAAGRRLASSYELVTISKASSIEKYFAIEKARYNVCVEMARLEKRSVKPFPSLPADNIIERTTYIGDGRSLYQRSIETVLDTNKMKPGSACIANVYRRADTQVFHNGMMQHSYAEADGREVVDEATEGIPEALNEILMRGYKFPKTVNQVSLKCAKPHIEEGGTKRIFEDCVVDPALGVFTDGFGGPLTAYGYLLEPVRDIELTVEPVSLTVGQRIDPRVFSLPAAK